MILGLGIEVIHINVCEEVKITSRLFEKSTV